MRPKINDLRRRTEYLARRAPPTAAHPQALPSSRCAKPAACSVALVAAPAPSHHAPASAGRSRSRSQAP